MASASTADNYRTYWSVVAQVLPVLALAIVVEARTITTRWAESPEQDLRARRGIMTTWIVALGSFLFVEPISIEGALDGRSHTPTRVLVIISVYAGLAALVAVPIVDLVLRRNAEAAASLLIGAHRRAQRRNMKRREAFIRTAINDSSHVLLEVNRALSQHEDLAAQLAQPELADLVTREDAQTLERGREAYANLSRARAEMLPNMQEQWRAIALARAGDRQALERLQGVDADTRARIVAAVRRLGYDLDPEPLSRMLWATGTGQEPQQVAGRNTSCVPTDDDAQFVL